MVSLRIEVTAHRGDICEDLAPQARVIVAAGEGGVR